MTTDHASLTLAAATARADRPSATRFVAAGIVAGLAVALLAALGSGRLLALGVIGLLLGLALYHSAFGFSHGWRVLMAEGRTAHVRAQVLMLAVAVALFLPLIAQGEVFGQPVRGFTFPLGSASPSAPSSSAWACRSPAAASPARSTRSAAARSAW